MAEFLKWEVSDCSHTRETNYKTRYKITHRKYESEYQDMKSDDCLPVTSVVSSTKWFVHIVDDLFSTFLIVSFGSSESKRMYSHPG